MLPLVTVMLPLLSVMLPASAAEDIAKVKSEAQRLDVKRFILILLVTERLTEKVCRLNVCHFPNVNFQSAFPFQLVRLSLFQGLCHEKIRGELACKSQNLIGLWPRLLETLGLMIEPAKWVFGIQI